MSPHVPEVPGYVDLELIGAGGFSVVYAATQLGLQRPVALKVINAHGPEAAQFEREAVAIGALSDVPGVVDAFHVTTATDGRPVIVMPRFERSLDDVIREQGPVPLATVLGWAAELARALDGAHALGIAHRDVKPANILISRRGDAFLADFGIAVLENMRASTLTVASFTPLHAPPERFNGREDSSNHRAGDVYSLASTLYTALTGTPPFGTNLDGGPVAMMERVVHQAVPTHDALSPPVHTVLVQAMAKEPRDRPRSAAAFVDRLTIAARRQSAPKPVRPAIAEAVRRPPSIDDTIVGGVALAAPPGPPPGPRRQRPAPAPAPAPVPRPLRQRPPPLPVAEAPLVSAVRDRFSDGPSRRRLGLAVIAMVVAVAAGGIAARLNAGLDPTDGSGADADSRHATATIPVPDLRLVVANGSSLVGRAKLTAEFLQTWGYTEVTYVEGTPISDTTVFFAPDREPDGRAVARLLGLGSERVLSLPTTELAPSEPDAQVVVLLGTDDTERLVETLPDHPGPSTTTTTTSTTTTSTTLPPTTVSPTTTSRPRPKAVPETTTAAPTVGNRGTPVPT